MSDEQSKFCMDCRWCKPAGGVLRFGKTRWEFAECMRPNARRGEQLINPKMRAGFCTTERSYVCGEKAEYFEPKPERAPSPLDALASNILAGLGI